MDVKISAMGNNNSDILRFFIATGADSEIASLTNNALRYCITNDEAIKLGIFQ